jgi:hypothetical protein
MAKAKRVHSTPRRTASKTKLTPPAESRGSVSAMAAIQPPTTEERIRINASRADAYPELEGVVGCDAYDPNWLLRSKNLHKQYYAISDERS